MYLHAELKTKKWALDDESGKRVIFLSLFIVRVFIFYFLNLLFVVCFLMWGDIKWWSRPIPFLFYGLGLS